MSKFFFVYFTFTSWQIYTTIKFFYHFARIFVFFFEFDKNTGSVWDISERMLLILDIGNRDSKTKLLSLFLMMAMVDGGGGGYAAVYNFLKPHLFFVDLKKNFFFLFYLTVLFVLLTLIIYRVKVRVNVNNQ